MKTQQQKLAIYALVPIATLIVVVILASQPVLGESSLPRNEGNDSLPADSVYVQNAEEFGQAQALGHVSPVVDLQRIALPVETLRQTALAEARGELGLTGEPMDQTEYYMTHGQYLSLSGMNDSPAVLPDRTVPAYVTQFRGVTAASTQVEPSFFEVGVNAITGEVFITGVGPGTTARVIDVTIADQGYEDRSFALSLTPSGETLPVAPTPEQSEDWRR